jgi:UDP-N-acetylmuramate--alanine ligase
MPGVDSTLIVDAARAKGGQHVELISDMANVANFLAPQLQWGDLVLVLGAGNINQIVPELLNALEAQLV